MKKWIGLMMVVGVLLTFGCSQEKPEVAAKEIVEQMVAAKHPGFDLDTSKLAYKVVQQDDATARVEVHGKIEVAGAVPLVKEGTKWVLDQRGQPAPAEAPKSGKAAEGETGKH